MKLALTQFLTLDGVHRGPGFPDEDTSDGFTRGGWFVPYLGEAFEQPAATWLGQADALLLGRRTYVNFARDWPETTEPPFGPLVNGLPKYVASHALTEAEWNPTTILSGDVPAQVADLKRRPGRELQLHGSARLSQSLLAAGPIDELRLVIAPVLVGTGRRLFPAGVPPTGLRLVRHETAPRGLAVHTYETTGQPEYGTYGADA